eukprot:COSAG06_NODE_29533_length_554_cov_3.589011_1_plen_89_part_01
MHEADEAKRAARLTCPEHANAPRRWLHSRPRPKRTQFAFIAPAPRNITVPIDRKKERGKRKEKKKGKEKQTQKGAGTEKAAKPDGAASA